jgi:hypothetical protein
MDASASMTVNSVNIYCHRLRVLTCFFCIANIPIVNCNSSRASVAKKKKDYSYEEGKSSGRGDVNPEISNTTQR